MDEFNIKDGINPLEGVDLKVEDLEAVDYNDGRLIIHKPTGLTVLWANGKNKHLVNVEGFMKSELLKNKIKELLK